MVAEVIPITGPPITADELQRFSSARPDRADVLGVLGVRDFAAIRLGITRDSIARGRLPHTDLGDALASELESALAGDDADAIGNALDRLWAWTLLGRADRERQTGGLPDTRLLRTLMAAL